MNHSPHARPPPLLILIGPTASGKTELGIALAQRLNGEILSADSRQVYRRFDIGTAKPTADEQRAAPHHLIDVADPTEQLSAGAFARLADEAIADIHVRGRLPIMVGGTGLWIRAMLYGLPPLPTPSPSLRARLAAELETEGLPAMVARLAGIDPEAAASIDRANPVRVLRALELHALTGERPSALWAGHRFETPRYDARLLGIAPPKDALHRRIETRARAMFEGGLLDEARALLADGLGNSPAFQAIGYPQARAALEGSTTVEEAIAQTALATRRYAKRQLTWFRAEKGITWLPWPVDTEAALTMADRA